VFCDDDGNVLPGAEEQVHALGQTHTLNEIEQAVEEWRRQALPQLESDLLQAAQTEFTQELKKTAKPSAMAADESC